MSNTSCYAPYSVLMSVYKKENAAYLRTAMDSMFTQTLPPEDFVLVCDGPLTDELNTVIQEEKKLHPGVLNVVRLETNQGLGKALKEGLNHCKNELVARMDSDDISLPDRCEKQIRMFQSTNLDIVSGKLEEFSGAPDNIVCSRALPEHHKDIVRFAKKRSPFNHPCVMFRKSSVLRVGSYQDFFKLEDYYLWVRMLQNGCIGYNIPETILHMRAGDDMYKRRGGLDYAKSQKKLFRYMCRQGFISFPEYLLQTSIRTASACMPGSVRQVLFGTFVRKKA